MDERHVMQTGKKEKEHTHSGGHNGKQRNHNDEQRGKTKTAQPLPKETKSIIYLFRINPCFFIHLHHHGF